MSSAVFDSVAIDIKAGEYIFRTTGQKVKFQGFMKVYSSEKEKKELDLPPLERGDVLTLIRLEKDQHFTEPPPRYNEASLVKTLEEFGIGRPSTYAPIISVIQDRGYVEKNSVRRFEPTETGVVVNKVLSEHFPQIVDIKFTTLHLLAGGELGNSGSAPAYKGQQCILLPLFILMSYVVSKSVCLMEHWWTSWLWARW